jgi:hypothetical protein
MKSKHRKPKTVTLYHYTSYRHLGLILNAGELNRGDVPVTWNTGYNAVWFCHIPSIDHQINMLMSPNDDKSEIRITVEFPYPFPRLYRWRDVASRIGVDRQVYRSLDNTANHGSNSWWIYVGAIPVGMFKSIERRLSKNSSYELIDLQEQADEIERLKEQVRNIKSVMMNNVTVLPFPDIETTAYDIAS